jgi:hypothetical protein
MAELAWITFDQFSGRVGEEFVVRSDAGGAIRTELVEATESPQLGGSGPEGQKRHQFSLVFLGPADPVLTQGIHHIQHDELGELDLFLVPIGPGPDGGQQYQSLFA